MPEKKKSAKEIQALKEKALQEKTALRLNLLRSGKWGALKRKAKELLGGEKTYLPETMAKADQIAKDKAAAKAKARARAKAEAKKKKTTRTKATLRALEDAGLSLKDIDSLR